MGRQGLAAPVDAADVRPHCVCRNFSTDGGEGSGRHQAHGGDRRLLMESVGVVPSPISG